MLYLFYTLFFYFLSYSCIYLLYFHPSTSDFFKNLQNQYFFENPLPFYLKIKIYLSHTNLLCSFNSVLYKVSLYLVQNFSLLFLLPSNFIVFFLFFFSIHFIFSQLPLFSSSLLQIKLFLYYFSLFLLVIYPFSIQERQFENNS